MRPMRERLFVFAVACVLAAPLSLAAPGIAGRQTTAAAEPGPKTVVTTRSDRDRTKIQRGLEREIASSAPNEEIQIVARVVAGTSLAPYVERSFARPWVDPSGMTVVVATAKPSAIVKLAGLRGVISLQLPESLVQPPKPISSRRADLTKPEAKVVVDGGSPGPAPTGWFHTGPAIHRSTEAWEKGYTGDGVTLMSNDSGADYCHPDLHGTWAYIDDSGSPYHGLPEMFDSLSSFFAASDHYDHTTLIADGLADYADTSRTAIFRAGSGGTFRTRYSPLGAPRERRFTLPKTSKSGVYHIGSHPDNSLAGVAPDIAAILGSKPVPAAGERAGVLVVDERTAGVYDTVYVDLNYNFDFRDDAPARLSRDFKSKEAACLDYDEDGLNDISGGLVYFISDGHTAVPTLDWFWGIPGTAYGNGNLVAFHVQDFFQGGGDHGQGTTSVATGQGVVAGNIFHGPAGPPVAGGKGLVMGPGKDVRTTQNGNFYDSPFIEDAFVYAGYGYDGESGTGDDVQIVSNSWALSTIDNDGLDPITRLIDLVHITTGPNTSILFATGNGGPGYGTDAAVDPPSGIGVAAASLSDTHGAFYPDITEDQIVGGDVISFSNRGPTPRNVGGADVLAIGAFGTGDLSLNETLWGAIATGMFGGTSMATPVASGNLALIYDAFRERTGRWPTFEEARALLMGSGRDMQHDAWSQGGGLVDADAGTDIAAGLKGVLATPVDWSAGSYRGVDYPAFTHVLARGASDSQTFTLRNNSSRSVKVDLSAERLSRIGTRNYSFTTGPASNDHGAFPTPDYLIRLDRDIPAGTDLVQVRVGQSRANFDPEGDVEFPFSLWETDIEDWTDRDGDGRFWRDANRNGKVDVGEIDTGENNSLGFDGAAGPTQMVRLGDPREQMHDGLFISLYHFVHPDDATRTDLTIEVTYWRQVKWGWVDLNASSRTVPAHGSATFRARMTVPGTASLGEYEGTIQVARGSRIQTIPITVGVAGTGTSPQFGGISPQNELYDNGRMGGHTNAGWRPETGDWRFYFTDIRASDLPAGASSFLMVDNRWSREGVDIDTLVFGPTPDCFSNGVGCEGLASGFPGDPARYGPYSLATVARSVDTNLGDGRWLFQTSSGGSREAIVAPLREGLHAVVLHHVVDDGRTLLEPFSTRVGRLSLSRSSITAPPDTSPVNITLSSQLALSGLSAAGFGLSRPVTTRETVLQDDPTDPSTASFSRLVTVANGGQLDISTANSGLGSDIDLYVYAPDGSLLGVSASPTDTERVSLFRPADGTYRVDVHGWNVPGGTDQFDLTIDAIQGTNVSVSGLAASIPAGGSDTFSVAWNTAGLTTGTYRGVVLLGPAEAPTMFRIPVQVTVP